MLKYRRAGVPGEVALFRHSLVGDVELCQLYDECTKLN